MKGTYRGFKQFGKMYSCNIDGDFLGTGPVNIEQQYGISEGDVIEFETEQRGKFTNIKPDTIKKVASAQPFSAKSGGIMNKFQYWENKAEEDKTRQVAIEHQSSRNAAIDTVGIMLDNDLVSKPTKKADQYAFVMELIDKITVKYNTDVEMTKQYGLNLGTEEVEAQEVTDDLD